MSRQGYGLILPMNIVWKQAYSAACTQGNMWNIYILMESTNGVNKMDSNKEIPSNFTQQNVHQKHNDILRVYHQV